MVTMPIPPRDVFAAAARKAIEDHDEWDAPDAFQTLHWDGEKLSCRTFVCVLPDVNPPDYPALMAKAAIDELTKHPDHVAYAYLLQMEMFGVSEPGPDASAQERQRYDRDRIGRTFHQRDDAIEACVAWVADVHGRLWSAAKMRNRPGRISETFYQPGQAPGGQMIRGLLAVATATGVMGYGLPGPQGLGLGGETSNV